MFDTLFGAEVSPALKFFLAFVFVIALIGVVAWLVRRFGGERFGGTAARGRQPRLAVVDAAAVDGRRRLVIIRRDNVEHLLMIGGPTDVVVEQNIVRAMGAPRDKTVEPTLARGLSISETLTRPMPLGEGTPFPLQPAPETNGRTPRLPEEPAQWTWPTHSEPQRPLRAEPKLEKFDKAAKADKPEPLNNLADELSARPSTPREPTFVRPVTPPPVSRPAPTPPAAAAAAPAEKPEKADKTPAATDDQNLADMANLLGASLRRGNEPRVESPAPVKAEPAVPPPAPRITPEPPKPAPPPARAEAKPKAVYDSLEEEMASLLGRPPGKT